MHDVSAINVTSATDKIFMNSYISICLTKFGKIFFFTMFFIKKKVSGEWDLVGNY